MQPNLTILIPTLTERKQFLDRLLQVIAPQCLHTGVKILTAEDNREKTIGEKRNYLIDNSKTNYSVFIDDDDTVSADYIDQIMIGINKGVDVVSFRGVITSQGKNPQQFIHKIGLIYEQKGNAYFRPPNHLNPMKTEYVKQIRFPETSFGEDADFAKRLAESGLLKTEYFIDKPIYFYQYRRVK